jgi:hypothetical protein
MIITQSFTPGPWEAFDDEIVAARTDVHVADVPLEDGTNPTEWQANLRLIAAAPDLLDALKAFCGDYESTPLQIPEIQAAYRHALTVIAKAEGR